MLTQRAFAEMDLAVVLQPDLLQPLPSVRKIPVPRKGWLAWQHSALLSTVWASLSTTTAQRRIKGEAQALLVLNIIQAAANSRVLPAAQHSKALLQALAAWYTTNILLEPCALVQDGRFTIKPEAALKRPSLTGSASIVELTHLLQGFGQPLAEQLASTSSAILVSAARAQDAILARQTCKLMQLAPKHGACKELDQPALQATMQYLNMLGRCLTFRANLAKAVAAASIRKTSPFPIASLMELPSLHTKMLQRADPALGAAISSSQATAKRWSAWQTVTGPHASQEQMAQMWQELTLTGARAELYRNLEALRVCREKAELCPRSQRCIRAC